MLVINNELDQYNIIWRKKLTDFYVRKSGSGLVRHVTGTGSGLLEENPQSGCTEIRALQRATIGVLPTYATRWNSGMKRVKCGWTQPFIPQVFGNCFGQLPILIEELPQW